MIPVIPGIRTSMVALLMLACLSSCVEEPVYYPVLVTIEPLESDITMTGAKLKAEVKDAGNQKITEYGIEIYRNIITNPAGRQTIQGAPSAGIFEVNFTGLEPGTKYYFRAYALINTAEFYSQNAMHQFTTKTE